MAKSLFLTLTPHDQTLPPMDAEGGYCLHYTDKSGVLRGGWACVGPTAKDGTAMMWVEASDTVLDKMAADGKYLYLCEAEENPNLSKITRQRKTPEDARKWLAAKNPAAAGMTIKNDTELLDKVCTLHKVDRQQMTSLICETKVSALMVED